MTRILALLFTLLPFAVAADTTNTVTLQWDPVTHDSGVSGYEVHYGTSPGVYTSTVQANSNGAQTNTCDISGLDPQTVYYFALRSVDSTGTQFSVYSNEVNSAQLQSPGNPLLSLTTVTTCPVSFYMCDQTPTTPDSGDDGLSVELGSKFTVPSAGSVEGVAFYKAETNLGTHTVTLWDANGNQLASKAVSNETASGWQTQNFDSPVHIDANTTYIVSYHTNTGHYSSNSGYFATVKGDSTITYPANSSGSPNGVFDYNSAITFPTNGYNASNYWVAAIFSKDQ